jgi:hypothetical protein
LFPKIIKLALDLPNKVTQPIPILKQGNKNKISFIIQLNDLNNSI